MHVGLLAGDRARGGKPKRAKPMSTNLAGEKDYFTAVILCCTDLCMSIGARAKDGNAVECSEGSRADQERNCQTEASQVEGK